MRRVFLHVFVLAGLFALNSCGVSENANLKNSDGDDFPISHIAADMRAERAKGRLVEAKKPCGDLGISEVEYQGMVEQLAGEYPSGASESMHGGHKLNVGFEPDGSGKCEVSWSFDIVYKGSEVARSGTCRILSIDGTLEDGRKAVGPMCLYV